MPPQLASPAVPIIGDTPSHQPDAEAEAEAVTVAGQVVGTPDQPQVVGEHVLDRLRAQQANPVQLDTVQEHLQEPVVIDGGRRAAGAGREALGRVGQLQPLVDPGSVYSNLVQPSCLHHATAHATAPLDTLSPRSYAEPAC